MKTLPLLLCLAGSLQASEIYLDFDTPGQASGNTYDYSFWAQSLCVDVSSGGNDGAWFSGDPAFPNVFNLNNGECENSTLKNFTIPGPRGSFRGLIAIDCVFTGDLSQVDLRDSAFTSVTFQSTALTGNLGTAAPRTGTFTNTTFDNMTLTGNLSNWSFIGVSLVGADLSGVTGTVGTVVNSTADASTNFGTNTALAQQFTPQQPIITVEQPAASTVANGGTTEFGNAATGHPVSLAFTIRNTGAEDLNGLIITKDGTDAAAFTVTSPPVNPVPSGATTTFTITFSPVTSGAKSATLHIASNAPGDNPYDINLIGTGYAFTEDSDGDGLNDASEVRLAALGFNPTVSQTALVTTYYAAAEGAGLFTAAQLQALHPQAPLVSKDPTTGKVTLRLDMRKSTDLTQFDDFPAGPAEVSVNPAGDIEFEFTPEGNTAFFRLKVD